MTRIKQITIEGTTYGIESDSYEGDLVLLNMNGGSDRSILLGWATIKGLAFDNWMSSDIKSSREYFCENWIDDNLELLVRELFVEATLIAE